MLSADRGSVYIEKCALTFSNRTVLSNRLAKAVSSSCSGTESRSPCPPCTVDAPSAVPSAVTLSSMPVPISTPSTSIDPAIVVPPVPADCVDSCAPPDTMRTFSIQSTASCPRGRRPLARVMNAPCCCGACCALGCGGARGEATARLSYRDVLLSAENCDALWVGTVGDCMLAPDDAKCMCECERGTETL